MFENFFDFDLFDFTVFTPVAAVDQGANVLTGSDTPNTIAADAGGAPSDPVDPGPSPSVTSMDLTSSAVADQAVDPVDNSNGTDDSICVICYFSEGANGDAAITLDGFSLYGLDIFT